MRSASKPWWRQATALVSVSASGAITGFSFAPQAAAGPASPVSMPIRLLALQQAAQSSPADDAALRAATVNVARYYLQMARSRTPAEMEKIIWQYDSTDGASHGPSCAAFASMTLELAAQVTGQQSWVTGGSSYPWPLHQWADVRVDPNPASLGITSILQDAQAHQRWHPLGDGYQPLPGDWVLFDGHVEVVTQYADGILHTIGGDSLPNFSINAHSYRDPLAGQGVTGFVDNSGLPSGGNETLPGPAPAPAGPQEANQAIPGVLSVPGIPAAALATPDTPSAIPGAPAAGPDEPAGLGLAPSAEGTAIPGLPVTAPSPDGGSPSPAAAPYGRFPPPSGTSPAPGTGARQAFIDEVAPGAITTQRQYGVPASVTIAQAITESGWGQSKLATQDHNLFGIKGSGPAGIAPLPTQEYKNGQWVTVTAAFRAYHDIAESIDDHGRLLATSQRYSQAMANRDDPNAFAAALTGVYATAPSYGATLIGLMQQYDLYRYDVTASSGNQPPAPPGPAQPGAAQAGAAPASPPGGAAIPGLSVIPGFSGAFPAPQASTSPAAPAPAPASSAPPEAATAGNAPARPSRYRAPIPPPVRHAFLMTARTPLTRGEPLYRDVARGSGIGWELLAACDWMQCEARSRYSPVHGEKLGTASPDGTVYPTKSAALAQCADDLAELAWAVYGIDLTTREALSVRDLADAFAAFRWGGLLKRHRTSAMEFPYSVAGLTDQHMTMRWPAIAEPDAPDKPGSRFRKPFGAVPIVLSLGYPATV